MSMPKSRSSSKHTPTGKPVHSGGGLTTNKLKNVRQSTRERPKMNAVNVKAVFGLGTKQGNHASDGSPRGRDLPVTSEPFYQGKGYPTTLGNVKALEGAGSGAKPGGGNREILPSGYQCLHGKPAQGIQREGRGKDILSEFGPDKRVG